jgi:hypothetical protein
VRRYQVIYAEPFGAQEKKPESLGYFQSFAEHV